MAITQQEIESLGFVKQLDSDVFYEKSVSESGHDIIQLSVLDECFDISILWNYTEDNDKPIESYKQIERINLYTISELRFVLSRLIRIKDYFVDL